jgi:uncharacterized protein YndB with AHSA1/START domain
MQDRIEREITIRASQERVFKAITDPAQLIAWFPDKVDGELKEGQQPVFTFDGYGRSSVYVVKVQPYDYFAYRWVQTVDPEGFVGDVLSQPNTIVEFHLREEGGATVVKVTETGFAGLPDEVAKKKFTDNTEGWAYMVNRLQELLEK